MLARPPSQPTDLPETAVSKTATSGIAVQVTVSEELPMPLNRSDLPNAETRRHPFLRRLLPIAILAALVASMLALNASAVEPVNKSFFGGVAIDGYDPVAYFSDGRPAEGSKDFTHEWNGAVWRFASAEHRDQFAADPEKYAPQYGGYCAWAVAQGKTAGIDPDAWKIVDGKLYLNYNKKIQTRWEGDMAANIEAADENWPGLVDH